MKAQNQSWVASAYANRHSEGIGYKPRDGEVLMCPRVGRMGLIK
jgi:hypothetical protein